MPESLPVYLQVIVGGLLLGALYALLASGLNLIFGVLKVINICHGELMMLGAYAAFGLFALWNVHPLLSIPVTFALLFLLGIAIEKTLVERVAGAPELSSLLLTFGIGIFLTSAAMNVFKADFRSVPALTGSILLWEIALPRARLASFVTALFITGGAYLFLKRTRAGKAIRAASQNALVAETCGINVARIRLFAYGLGAGMAGAAGNLIALSYSFNPEVGHVFNLKAFAIIVLGGMGNFAGAFWGGLLLGVVEGLTGYIATAQVVDAVAYLLMLLFLLFRPSGLMGTAK